MRPDGCVYQGPTEHSSPIASVQGALVTTRSGNRYVLGALDPLVADVMHLISPGSFNPADPLAPSTQKLLLFATSVAYGPAAAHAARLRDAVAGLEGALADPSTGPIFAVVRQAFLSLGVRV